MNERTQTNLAPSCNCRNSSIKLLLRVEKKTQRKFRVRFSRRENRRGPLCAVGKDTVIGWRRRNADDSLARITVRAVDDSERVPANGHAHFTQMDSVNGAFTDSRNK